VSVCVGEITVVLGEFWFVFVFVFVFMMFAKGRL
jgi:hypothetical protein